MKAKAMSLGASMLVMALLLFPTGAYAQFRGIFSAILSTITGPIGGALTDINQIRSSILKTEQQVLWPVTLIAQAQNYISTIKASYRGWMNAVLLGWVLILGIFGILYFLAYDRLHVRAGQLVEITIYLLLVNVKPAAVVALGKNHRHPVV
jgi:hypothetical protein